LKSGYALFSAPMARLEFWGEHTFIRNSDLIALGVPVQYAENLLAFTTKTMLFLLVAFLAGQQ
jgi:hypothetical protein